MFTAMQNSQLQISAPIIPGRSAAGIALGTAIGEVPAIANGLLRQSYYAAPHLPDGFVIRHRSPWLEVWESAGRVARIIVREGYTGLVEEAIGIGSTLAELEESAGMAEPADDETVFLPDLPGISFTVALPPNTGDDDPGTAVVTAITIVPLYQSNL